MGLSRELGEKYGLLSKNWGHSQSEIRFEEGSIG